MGRALKTAGMRACLIVIACADLVLGSAVADGQTVNLDSLRRAQRLQVEQYRAQAAAAAAVFLDRTRPASDRLAAVRDISAFVEAPHVDGSVAVALDQREPVAIRVRAIQLAGDRVERDTTFEASLLSMITDRTAAPDLRYAAIGRVTSGTFGALTVGARSDKFFDALRTAARDADIRLRRAALGALAGYDDQPTLSLLAQGLSSPAGALLPPREAVRLLGLRDPTPYYPLLNRLMLQPPDSATRLAAIQLLGGHAPSRAQIVGYLRDPAEPPAIRQAALSALAVGDPAGFPQQVLAVVADEAAPLDLRLRAIKIIEVRRTSRDPKVLGRAADEFDRLMERLITGSQAGAIREAARVYLVRTKSAQ